MDRSSRTRKARRSVDSAQQSYVDLESLTDVDSIIQSLHRAYEPHYSAGKVQDAVLKTAQNVAEKLQISAKRNQILEQSTSSKPGVPRKGVKWRHTKFCSSCEKAFTAFYRGHHCRSCGHSFCKRCSMHKQVLPHSFGYGDTPVRVCNDCLDWFQQTLESLFITTDTSHILDHNHRYSGNYIPKGDRRKSTSDIVDSSSGSDQASKDSQINTTNSARSQASSKSPVSNRTTQDFEEPMRHSVSIARPNSNGDQNSIPDTTESIPYPLLREVSIAEKKGLITSNVRDNIVSLIEKGKYGTAQVALEKALGTQMMFEYEDDDDDDEEDDHRLENSVNSCSEDDEDEDEEEESMKSRAGHRTLSLDAVEWRDRSSRPKSSSVLESQLMLVNGVDSNRGRLSSAGGEDEKQLQQQQQHCMSLPSTPSDVPYEIMDAEKLKAELNWNSSDNTVKSALEMQQEQILKTLQEMKNEKPRERQQLQQPSSFVGFPFSNGGVNSSNPDARKSGLELQQDQILKTIAEMKRGQSTEPKEISTGFSSLNLNRIVEDSEERKSALEMQQEQILSTIESMQMKHEILATKHTAVETNNGTGVVLDLLSPPPLPALGLGPPPSQQLELSKATSTAGIKEYEIVDQSPKTRRGLRSVSVDVAEIDNDRSLSGSLPLRTNGSRDVCAVQKNTGANESRNSDPTERQRTSMSLGYSKGASISSYYPSSVLLFAVYKIELSEGIRRTFGFAKKSVVLDRYTLKVFRMKGIVQARGVFRHRFWSFRCDSVRKLNDTIYGDECVELVMCIGQGEQSLVFQFASVKQREQFTSAIMEWKVTGGSSAHNPSSFFKRSSQEDIHSNSSSPSATMSTLNSQVCGNITNPYLLLNTGVEEDSGDGDITSFSLDSAKSLPLGVMRHCRGIGSNSTSSTLVSPNPTIQSDVMQPMVVSFLNGEKEVQGTAWPATLIQRSSGDTDYEVWGRIRGVVSITNFRVLFLPYDKGYLRKGKSSGRVAYIPLFAIESAQREVTGRKSRGSGKMVSGSLILKCKDFRTMRIEVDGFQSISEERTQALTLLITALAESTQRNITVEQKSSSNEVHSCPPSASPTGPFAFSYSLFCAPWQDGWNIYDPAEEFTRQKVHFVQDNSKGSIFKLFSNVHGGLCRSYPEKVLLPSAFSATKLHSVAAYRAKGRLPAITWVHPRHGCVLSRSGQPLLGNILTGGASTVDQELIDIYRRLPDIIHGNVTKREEMTRTMYIFDARKMKASAGNRLMGKGGVENSQDYPGTVICHLNISNIYKMQSSYYALMKVVLDAGSETMDKSWSSLVESTRWIEHIHLILEGSLKIARVLELEGASVLVHCSDGWDRTSQLTALAQIMIDPYFRTIKGFATIVEKDWCSFGHKFSERLGGDRARDPHGAKWSPIMLQFLDAVWQISRQFPTAFEFNEDFLLHVGNSLSSGLYGTFLYDTRLQRDAHGVKRNTVSVWTPVLLNLPAFTNPNYEELNSPIWPWTGYAMIRLWEAYFFQWHPKYPNCRWISTLVHHDTDSLMEEKPLPSAHSDSDVSWKYGSERAISLGAVPMPVPSMGKKRGYTSSTKFFTRS